MPCLQAELFYSHSQREMRLRLRGSLGPDKQTAVVMLGIVHGFYSIMGGRGKGGGSATFMDLLTQKPGEEFSLKLFRFCIRMNEAYGPFQARPGGRQAFPCLGSSYPKHVATSSSAQTLQH